MSNEDDFTRLLKEYRRVIFQRAQLEATNKKLKEQRDQMLAECDRLRGLVWFKKIDGWGKNGSP